MADFKGNILEAAEKKILYTVHALDQMNKPERMISKGEIKEVLNNGEIIEDYPADERGHSCLMAGETALGRVVHVVCSPQVDYLALITAYIPTEDTWEDGFKQRKR